MRFAIFPGGDEDRASSRIRAYTLASALRAAGHETQMDDASGADVVLIQKRVSARTVSVARTARKQGALIVYDADDVGAALWWFVAPRILHRLLPLVDVMITDTEQHATAFRRNFCFAPVEVVPDAADYYPAAPARPPLAPESPLRILWFGDASNFTLFAKYAETLRGVRDAEVLVVTNAAAIGSLAQRFTGISFLPWSRDTFPSILQSAALSLLTHDGTEADRAKSNNRMITSITWGVPAVVSRTPEYERTARECQIETSLFDDPEACVAAIERLRTRTARSAYLDAAQAEVWQRYSPAAVSGRFLTLVARHRDSARPGRKMPTYWQWLRSASMGGLSDALRSELRHALRP